MWCLSSAGTRATVAAGLLKRDKVKGAPGHGRGAQSDWHRDAADLVDKRVFGQFLPFADVHGRLASRRRAARADRRQRDEYRGPHRRATAPIADLVPMFATTATTTFRCSTPQGTWSA